MSFGMTVTAEQLQIIVWLASLVGYLFSIWAVLNNVKQKRQEDRDKANAAIAAAIEKQEQELKRSIEDRKSEFNMVRMGYELQFKNVSDEFHKFQLKVSEDYVSRKTLEDLEQRVIKQLENNSMETRSIRTRLDELFDVLMRDKQ